MIKAIGTVLRALSVIWFAFAAFRMLAGLIGITRGTDIIIGIVGLAIAIATFQLGTWLKNRERSTSVSQRIQRAKSAWWRADYGFRLSVFLSVVWAIACYFWQDDYDRDLSIVFWPSIGMLTAYLGYRKFVVVRPAEVEKTMQDKHTMVPPAEDDFQVRQVEAVTDPTDLLLNQTSKERERAMNDLINKMK
jgi:hypothetical protein